jgi:uncharacterized protein with HEPN domain
MSRDDSYLHDIKDAAQLARAYVAGLTREQFLADLEKQDAVIRRLEIIGEAARRLSDVARARIPELPWRRMIGMRNILTHDYEEVDVEVVWRVLQDELPRLITRLEDYLARQPPPTNARPDGTV